MVALNEELSGIAEEPQARSGCGAAEGAMTFPRKNQSNPRSVPYCSDTYFPDSDFSRHYARKRNYSPSIGRSISQDPLQYINGANTYQFVMSNPVNGTDPLGLWHWYEPWTWPIWHSTPAKVAVDTAKHVPPGGEFCEALGTLYGISKSDIARDAHHQLYHDLNNPNARYYGNPLNDPLYNGLSLWAGGDTGNMTPQEHQAVQNWINSHYASHK